MVRTILQKLVLPLVVYIVFAVLATLFISANYGNAQDAAILVGLALLINWWGLALTRWIFRGSWSCTVSYISGHLVIGGNIFVTLNLIGYALQPIYFSLGTTLLVLTIPLAISWFLGALIHLVQNGEDYQYQSIWWRLLGVKPAKTNALRQSYPDLNPAHSEPVYRSVSPDISTPTHAASESALYLPAESVRDTTSVSPGIPALTSPIMPPASAILAEATDKSVFYQVLLVGDKRNVKPATLSESTPSQLQAESDKVLPSVDTNILASLPTVVPDVPSSAASIEDDKPTFHWVSSVENERSVKPATLNNESTPSQRQVESGKVSPPVDKNIVAPLPTIVPDVSSSAASRVDDKPTFHWVSSVENELSVKSATPNESSPSQRQAESDTVPSSANANILVPIPTFVPDVPSSAASRVDDKPTFHQVSLVEDERSNTSIRIPPRKEVSSSASSLPKGISPSGNAAKGTLPFVETKIAEPNGNFLEEAHRYAKRTQARTEFVPFMHYWPTYADMTSEQQAWYFYWRTEVRRGQILPTDTSYIFVHVYELLNLIGVPSPQIAFEQIVGLWRSYREEQPKLDNYLVDWIADFLVIHGLPVHPLDWYAQALESGAHTHHNEDLFVEAWLRKGAEIDELDANLLYHISGYSPRRSKFYKAQEDVFDVDRAFKLGISAVDKHLRRGGQPGLLQMHYQAKLSWIKRSPFAGAIHGYLMDEIFIAAVRPWAGNTALSEALSSIIRQTENLLRNQLNYRTQLRGISIPKAWDDAIRKALIEPPAKRVIDIDFAHAEQIRQQSETIRQRLMVEDETEAMDTTQAEAASAEEVVTPGITHQQPVEFFPSTQLHESIYASIIQRPANTPDGLLTDLPVVAQVMGQTDSESARLLSMLRENGWQAPPAVFGGYFESTFVNVIFDRINESAFDALGDALLFDEEGEWVVAEDYRDEITYILDHPNYRRKDASNLPDTLVQPQQL